MEFEEVDQYNRIRLKCLNIGNEIWDYSFNTQTISLSCMFTILSPLSQQQGGPRVHKDLPHQSR